MIYSICVQNVLYANKKYCLKFLLIGVLYVSSLATIVSVTYKLSASNNC